MSSSSIGWIDLAPAALRRLRQDLAPQQQGVRDEMGVLAIHTGYADHFFPGTSVLHQRPRYLFFTCWNYLLLAGAPGGGSTPLVKKEAAERWVRDQLVKSNQQRVIGKQVDTPAQPPDASYWSALRKWGFLPPNCPDRATLLAGRRRYRYFRDGDVRAGREETNLEGAIYLRVPEPPRFWFQSRPRQPLTFDLTSEEAELLLERLELLGPKCLLAVAARESRRRAPGNFRAWKDPLLVEAATSIGENARLVRARHASGLAHVIRAVYAALVEDRRWSTATAWERQRIEEPEHYRTLLREVFDSEVAEDALKTESTRIAEDLRLPTDSGSASRPGLASLVDATLEALRAVRCPKNVEAELLSPRMLKLYARIEADRKGSRARLPDTPKGLEMRRAFDHKTLGIGGLDYRWSQVAVMLTDLHRGLRS